MTEQIQAVKQEARDMNRDPITGTPGAHPVGTGVGAAGGAAAGAALGSMAGPIGTAVGGVVGAVAGGLAGKGVGEAVNPTGEKEDVVVVDGVTGDRVVAVDATDDDVHWQRAFITEPYYNSELIYDDYAPAYRAGYTDRRNNAKRTWEESETILQSEWERTKGASRLTWEEARDPIHAAWHHADSSLSTADPYFGVN